ncbi:integrase [Bradyrhizobium elkanii]|uniref:Integrase n=1 Tax=Bradyrhizobium elkanii TaxID=29448 RepID=A0ABV4FAI3_BRAEL|nr:integrase [Bradyrhizobium elkanii]MCS3887658.1 integrase [Bradyrhizobium elkanii]MCS4213323.1 integrase [Bradyrhizobium elkanii]MCW2213629.1 integrase [Bradyrhizobium elkanii]
MRISEAMGLERDDVDLDVGVLTVRQIGLADTPK